MTIFAFRELAALDENAVEERVLQVAQALTANVDRELSRAMITLETLATSGALEMDDLAAFHDQARRAISPGQAGILLVDRTLKQLLNTRSPFGTDLPPTSDPETANRVFATGERQVSDTFLGVVSKNRVINIEVPVHRGGTVRYVLIMAVDTRRFADLLAAQRLATEWVTEIIDRKGVILARSQQHEELSGRKVESGMLSIKQTAKGIFRVNAASGDRIMGASSRSGISGWLVTASLPMSVAQSSRRRGRMVSVTLIAAGLGLGIGLAFLFGAYITRPLSSATAAAGEVGRGTVVDYTPSMLQEANSLTRALSGASKELRRRQDHSDFLLRELAHRSKNQLAVIMGIATQTARHTNSMQEFIGQFNRRVQGLAKSQDLMVQRQWIGAPLEALVRGHLDQFGAQERAEISGPNLVLDGNAVQNVGFALHELATNATKYGALATPGARLEIRWQLTANGRVHIDWIETGITRVEQAGRQGFGSLVVAKLVPQALQGTATIEFGADKLHWHLDIPDTFVLRNI